MKITMFFISLTVVLLVACDNTASHQTQVQTTKNQNKLSQNPSTKPSVDEQLINTNNTPVTTAKVGFIASPTGNAPLNFLDDKGKMQGFEYDILQEIAKRSAYEFSYEYRPVEGIFDNLGSQDLRVIAGNIDINKQIQNKYAVSDSYLDAYPVTIISQDPSIKTLEQLKGKRIAIQDVPMKKSYQIVKAFNDENNGNIDNIHYVKSDWLAVKEVLSGKADAAVSNSSVIPYYVEEYSNKQTPLYFAIDYKYPQEYYEFVLHKKDDKLLQAFNQALADMKADGTYQSIYKKWF